MTARNAICAMTLVVLAACAVAQEQPPTPNDEPKGPLVRKGWFRNNPALLPVMLDFQTEGRFSLDDAIWACGRAECRVPWSTFAGKPEQLLWPAHLHHVGFETAFERQVAGSRSPSRYAMVATYSFALDSSEYISDNPVHEDMVSGCGGARTTLGGFGITGGAGVSFSRGFEQIDSRAQSETAIALLLRVHLALVFFWIEGDARVDIPLSTGDVRWQGGVKLILLRPMFPVGVWIGFSGMTGVGNSSFLSAGIRVCL